MADAVAMRAAFVRLGFSQAGAVAMVDEQGIDSLDELKWLDDDAIETVCSVVRKPGGQIPNPNAGAAGQPQMIPNPGTQVSVRAEGNLKLACYCVRHRERISRACDIPSITLQNVRALRDLKRQEEDHEDVEVPENLINARNWPKTVEGIREYFRGCLGVTKIPLAYVIREKEEDERSTTTLSSSTCGNVFRHDEIQY